jgi:acid phosphatase type 7
MGVSVTRRIVSILLVAIAVAILANACMSGETTSPKDSGPPIVAAAGDIADCASEGDESTAKLLEGNIERIITLGDNVYESGTPEEFDDCYDSAWGRFRERTRPVPGNHEYLTPQAKGYFGYFGEAAGDPDKGYYSYELGAWHIVALNSNCQDIGGCGIDSPEGQWLKNDLTDHRSKCTLAYFHYPLFSSGLYRPGISGVKPLWETLYSEGADVVLNGHDHNYQRFSPQDPDGKADPERGIRQFVVGTGGKTLYTIEGPISNTESFNDDTYGVLKLTLRPKDYSWQFLPAQGSSFTDSGNDLCH